MMNRSRKQVIRNGAEVWVLLEGLTADEREEIAERDRSPEARRRFGTRLREVRKREDKDLKDSPRGSTETGAGPDPR